MGSMSLSSSTSKDGGSHVLPHLGLGLEEQSLVNQSQGPDATIGVGHGGAETTANTVTQHDESKEETQKGGDSYPPQSPHLVIDKDSKESPRRTELSNPAPEVSPHPLVQGSNDKPAEPGANFPPSLTAEGEALTNELLQYILHDLSNEGLDHLINRQTRRQQGKSRFKFKFELSTLTVLCAGGCFAPVAPLFCLYRSSKT